MLDLLPHFPQPTMDLTSGALVISLFAIIIVAKSITKKNAQERVPLPPRPNPLPILTCIELTVDHIKNGVKLMFCFLFSHILDL